MRVSEVTNVLGKARELWWPCNTRERGAAALSPKQQADHPGAGTDHSQRRRRPERVHPLEAALHVGEARRQFGPEPRDATLPPGVRVRQAALPFRVQLREAALPVGVGFGQTLLKLRVEAGVVELVQLAEIGSGCGVHL